MDNDVAHSNIETARNWYIEPMLNLPANYVS